MKSNEMIEELGSVREQIDSLISKMTEQPTEPSHLNINSNEDLTEAWCDKWLQPTADNIGYVLRSRGMALNAPLIWICRESTGWRVKVEKESVCLVTTPNELRRTMAGLAIHHTVTETLSDVISRESTIEATKALVAAIETNLQPTINEEAVDVVYYRDINTEFGKLKERLERGKEHS